MDSFNIFRKVLTSETLSVENCKIANDALRRKRYKTLDMLLSTGVDFGDTLFGLNPFHILYMHSFAFQYELSDRNCGLAETTKVLLRYGFSPSVAQPPGSYPLYSLLHSFSNELLIKDQTNPYRYVTCLNLLLFFGANPEFDETSQLTFASRSINSCKTFGRTLYRSALFAFCEAILGKVTEDVTDEVITCIEAILASLLKCGVDLRKKNVAGIEVLQCFMQQIANKTGDIMRFKTLLGYLLAFGVDVDTPCCDKHFALECLFIAHRHLPSDRTVELSNCFKNGQLFSIINFALLIFNAMSQRASTVCLLNLSCSFSTLIDQHDQQLILKSKTVLSSITAYVSQPKSLFCLCRSTVWIACGRKMSHVQTLPLPSRVVSMFAFPWV